MDLFDLSLARLPQIKNNLRPRAVGRNISINESFAGSSIRDRSLKSWLPSLYTPDQDLAFELPILRARSRDLYRNGSIGRGSLRNYATSVIGSGLKMMPEVDRRVLKKYLNLSDDFIDEKEEEIEKFFREWAESEEADSERRQNFYQLQYLCELSQLMSGDVFVIMYREPRQNSLYKLRLKIIEADRVRNPNSIPGITSVSFAELFLQQQKRLFDGIQFDENGQPKIYHVESGGFSKFIEIPAFGELSGRQNIIHYYEMERPGQSRGIPFLTPIISIEKNRNRLTEAELAAAVVQSLLTVFIKSKNPDSLDDPLANDYAFNQTSKDVNRDELDFKLAPAAILQLSKDEEIDLVNPMRPNSSYTAFSTSLLKESAMALDIPAEIILKEFNASFTASRAALLIFNRSTKIKKELFNRKINRPVYEEIIIDGVEDKHLDLPGFLINPIIRRAWLGQTWTSDSLGSIQEMVEVNAAKARIAEGFSTHAAETILLTGGNWKKNVRKLKQENQMLADAIKPIQNINIPAGG